MARRRQQARTLSTPEHLRVFDLADWTPPDTDPADPWIRRSARSRWTAEQHAWLTEHGLDPRPGSLDSHQMRSSA